MVRVALIAGGRSGEFDISLKSSAAVSDALGRLGHETLNLVITRSGTALLQGEELLLAEALVDLCNQNVDCAFIAMHGEYGEDGRIQGALDLLDIPYQGCGVTVSACAMSKSIAKLHYRDAGLPVADAVTLRSTDSAPPWGKFAAQLGLPLVLKTATSGSSVGIEVVESMEALEERGEELLAATSRLVIEKWLPGREFTVAVLEEEDGSIRALPVVEIRPNGARFFDYEAKYTPGATDEICPAPIEEDLEEELRRLGLEAHRALGCRHLSRTDFKCDSQGRPHLLETNTLPGLTPMSLLPKAAAAHGLSFDDLIARLLSLTLRDRA